MKQAARRSTKRASFPALEKEIGHDPAYYLDRDYNDRRVLIEARIKGIDYEEVAAAYIAVERRLGRGPDGGPRPRVLGRLEDRLEWLREHGDRDDRLDLEEIRQRRQNRDKTEIEEITQHVHKDCDSVVDRKGKLAFYCPTCEHDIPASAVAEVVGGETA